MTSDRRSRSEENEYWAEKCFIQTKNGTDWDDYPGIEDIGTDKEDRPLPMMTNNLINTTLSESDLVWALLSAEEWVDQCNAQLSEPRSDDPSVLPHFEFSSKRLDGQMMDFPVEVDSIAFKISVIMHSFSYKDRKMFRKRWEKCAASKEASTLTAPNMITVAYGYHDNLGGNPVVDPAKLEPFKQIRRDSKLYRVMAKRGQKNATKSATISD